MIDPPRRVLSPLEARELTRLIHDYTAAAITAAALPPGVDPAPAHAQSTATLNRLHDWIRTHTHGGQK